MDDLMDAIIEAKSNGTHEAVFVINDNVMMSIKNGLLSMTDYLNECVTVLEKNQCSMSCIAEGTMRPKVLVRYYGE